MLMKTLHASATVVAISCVLMSIAACGPKKQADNPQTFFPQDNQQQQPVTTGPATTQPQQQQPQPAGPVTSSDPALQQAMAIALMPRANTDAKGMRKEGDVMAANLQEGQSLETPVMLQAGKCYTVVGLGLPGIQDMSIILAPNIPFAGAPTVPISQSVVGGTQVSMAPMPNCYTTFLPLSAKIVITAKAGSGPVGAQLYVK